MPYRNISTATTDRARSYIDCELIGENFFGEKKEVQPNFFEKHILARGASLLLVPASLVTSALDSLAGLSTGVLAIGTLGLSKDLSIFSSRHLSRVNGLVADPYVNILKTINPTAKVSNRILVKDYICGPLNEMARDCSKSNNVFVRHVVARLSYVLVAVASLVTRAVDGVIGVPAAALSILLLGTCEELNRVAYAGLTAPGVIHDIFRCAVKFINPGAVY